MGSEAHPLHIFFFPFLAHGHIIPTIDMAKLFASKGVKATIITTPLNAPFISKTIGKSKTYSNSILVQTIKFPCCDAGLPDGCENIDLVPSPDLIPKFYVATKMLKDPFEELMLQQYPDCVVADLFFPWASDSAAKFGIPRLLFSGTSFFAICATESIRIYQPYNNVSSDSEYFAIPNLPHEIKLIRTQLSLCSSHNDDSEFKRLLEESLVSDQSCYGVIFNSFYELEKDYADHYRKVFGRKAWHIGPLSLCNRGIEEKAHRGKDASINEHECLKWLDTKKPNSVIYVCFGSTTSFPDSQLRNIALGLEASEQQFIWVIKKTKKGDEESREEWLPEGFEKRMEGKGLIIRGWAPQVLILEHEAIGAFVTHCGWNSILEGVTAGVPMVTWPIAAEQFYNEKLITDVLKIGVPVGAKKWACSVGDSIEWDAIEKAVKRAMVGGEAEQMRNKVRLLSQQANRVLDVGGSSYSDLNALIQELASLSH